MDIIYIHIYIHIFYILLIPDFDSILNEDFCRTLRLRIMMQLQTADSFEADQSREQRYISDNPFL
jgi:hypothetical protein